MIEVSGLGEMKPHIVRRSLEEIIAYPPHDKRSSSPEYKRVHHHLIYNLDEACWICGIRHSEGGHMETHHSQLEWALEGYADPALVLADFPEMGAADDEHLRAWLDSEGNMTVLCALHHRGALRGIHMITYPAWVAQRREIDHDITKEKL